MTEKQILTWFTKLSEYKSYAEAIGDYNKDLCYAGPDDNEMLAALIPETAWGIDLNICFYQHDAKYSIGGGSHERWLADIAMLSTGLYIIEKWPNRWYLTGLNSIRRHLARIRLVKYFEAVRLLGYQHFNFTDN
jgi:hypothetical protein